MRLFYVFFVFVLAMVCVSGYSQKEIRNETGRTSSEFKIDETKPSVYLEFDHLGTGMPVFAEDVKERVWLKLVNNTKVSIYINKFVFGKDNQIGLFHEVEKVLKIKNGPLMYKVKVLTNELDSEVPIGYRRGHVPSPLSELKSGEMVTFSVPKNHLADQLRIRIEFIFDWEFSSNIDKSLYSEPQHSIFFSSFDLERFPKKKND